MANAEGITPSRHEVERQLERMLSDPLFLARPKQSAIFEYLVKSALDGAEVGEKTLLVEFFTDKRYAEGTTSVRTTVSHIRTQLLKAYYDGNGQHDPVLITLPAPQRSNTRKKNYKLIRRPEGKAYTPSFRYNPASWIATELTVAHHLLRGGLSQIDQAMVQFDKVSLAEPGHLEVKLGVAEGWAIKLLSGAVGDPHITLVAGPLEFLDQIEKDFGASWRTHHIRAMLHFFMGDRKAAAKEFDKALTLNRRATITRGGYTDFLFRTGREEQALRFMELAAEEHAGDAQLQTSYAIHLARVRRYEQAERVFLKALLLDPNCWAAHFGIWEMFLAKGELEKAEAHARQLEALVTPEDFAFLSRKLGQQ
jgi:tetratricopeptide (TPR) repeat protein